METRALVKIDLAKSQESTSTTSHEGGPYLYAGELDFVAGDTIDKSIVNDLKHAALFYDRIIVQDGLLHCYGPLGQHLLRMSKASKADQQLDVVVRFLKE